MKALVYITAARSDGSTVIMPDAPCAAGPGDTLVPLCGWAYHVGVRGPDGVFRGYAPAPFMDHPAWFLASCEVFP